MVVKLVCSQSGFNIKEIDVKSFFEGFFEVIFSATTLFVLAAVGFGYIIVKVAIEQQEQETFCYAQNMVRVNTDAGARCALPNSLVEIK
jgi:hypothetical protein